MKSVALKLSTFGIQTGYNNLSGVPASYLLKSWRDIPSGSRCWNNVVVILYIYYIIIYIIYNILYYYYFIIISLSYHKNYITYLLSSQNDHNEHPPHSAILKMT